jgi:hypothetical protein
VGRLFHSLLSLPAAVMDDDRLETMYDAALGAVLLPVALVILLVLVVCGVLGVFWRALRASLDGR